MSLWHEGYFELKAVKTQHTQEELSAPAPALEQDLWVPLVRTVSICTGGLRRQHKDIPKQLLLTTHFLGTFL